MDFSDIYTLRLALHNCPERSGQEDQTRAVLMDFLDSHTALELRPCGAGFYAAHREANAFKPSVALRADYDALALPEGARPISAATTATPPPYAARPSPSRGRP